MTFSRETGNLTSYIWTRRTAPVRLSGYVILRSARADTRLVCRTHVGEGKRDPSRLGHHISKGSKCIMLQSLYHCVFVGLKELPNASGSKKRGRSWLTLEDIEGLDETKWPEKKKWLRRCLPGVRFFFLSALMVVVDPSFILAGRTEPRAPLHSDQHGR